MKSSHRPFITRLSRPRDSSWPVPSIPRRPYPAAILLCLCLAAAEAHGAAYKWTDEQGRVHYGDTIPPAEIHRSYEQLDKQGQVSKRVDAALSPQERAEQRRRAQEQAAAQEAERRNAIRDQYLIETYQTRDQVKAAYDANLASLDSSITLADSVLEKLGARRDALASRAAENERGGEMTQKLEEEIRDIDQQMEDQRRYIEERRDERRELEKTAAEDIARFEQLQAERLEAERNQQP
ncbi:MAG: DUF4124 domain-containing protein [Gammaproteobacteria bacterium]|nr:DUF4124 domain-containing protein [Gammaproteobacteria bacterium]